MNQPSFLLTTLIGFILLLPLSCDEASQLFSVRESEEAKGSVAPERVLTEGKIEGNFSEPEEEQVISEEVEQLFSGSGEVKPKVQLSPEAVVLNTLEVNLDLDRNDEQIIVVKENNSPDALIRLIIADYDTLRDGYVTAWEGETGSSQRRFFSVSINDLIGDHNLEIVCSGINSKGEQTIDLFRRGGGANGVSLSFESILSLEVKGTISIQEHERSQSYLNGLKNGDSFSVQTVVEEADERLRRLYAWRSTENRYILVQEERTPKQEIEDQKLKDLFNKETEAMIDFLSGGWINGEGATIYLDSGQDEITLYSGDIQEVYHWTSRYRFLSNSISLKGENELIPYMHIEVAIRIQDFNTILITLYDIDSHNGRRSINNSWSGTYFHSPISRGSEGRGGSTALKQELLPELSGFFQGESGEELYLDSPNFTLKQNKETKSGGYAVYLVDVPIFEFKFVGEEGVVRQQKAYRLVYREEEDAERVIRRMILVPGKIGVSGFSPDDDEQELRFRQVEYVNTEE